MTTTEGNASTAAVNRFGLGAKPGELARVGDAKEWLLTQLKGKPEGTSAFANLPSSLDYRREAAKLHMVRRAIDKNNTGREAFHFAGVRWNAPSGAAGIPALSSYRKQLLDARQEGFGKEADARFLVATTTGTPFLERLVHFWSNHFAVSVDKFLSQPFAAPMEREAIRPHVTGRFADLLLAVETHPAMLLYLDNFRSIGLNSRTAQRIKAGTATQQETDEHQATGMNENLGRECMELHTVGVHGGYQQADVIEVSRALTGWSVPFPTELADGGRAPSTAFVFRNDAHEPGARHVMGHTFAEAGLEQGKAVLEFLARQPATAAHLSRQLAQHFVADDPPESLVNRMAKAYLDHDTSLAAVYAVLIKSPEAWGPHARKFKTPQDFVLSALRVAQIPIGHGMSQAVLNILTALGEPLFEPRSPAGFPDAGTHWVNADGMWKRVQASGALATHVATGSAHPDAFARDALGPLLTEDTALAVHRAESVQQAYATVFACPAFQWRV